MEKQKLEHPKNLKGYRTPTAEEQKKIYEAVEELAKEEPYNGCRLI